jgi:integrase/recombinase XerC/integrase/recombinase XerD
MTADNLSRPAVELAAAPDIRLVLRAWRRHLEREQAPATVEAYTRALARFRASLEALPEPVSLIEVKPSHILEWREQLRRRYSVRSVNLYLAAVRSFYAWAIARGVDMPNPAAGIRGKGRRANTPHAREMLSDQEVLALLGTCRDGPIGRRDRAIFCLAAYCGLRGIELQRAQLGDLEIRSGRQVLWIQGKGRQEADEFVVIPAPVETALHAWLAKHPSGAGPLLCTLGMGRSSPGRALSLRALRAIWLTHATAAGIRSKRKTFHSLRHTAITNAIRHGASPLQVQHMARHADIKTTLAYYHETDRLVDPPEDRISYEDKD